MDVDNLNQQVDLAPHVLSTIDRDELQERFASLRNLPSQASFSSHGTKTSFQGIFNRAEFKMAPPDLAAYDPSQRYPLQHKVCLVPLTRVRHYVHRKELEDKMETYLAKSCTAVGVGHAVALTGMGGMGKTQLVLNYLRDHHEDFNPILWINAQTEKSALSSISQGLELIGLPAPTQQADSATAIAENASLLRLYRWLNKRSADDGKWLIILDSAEELTAGLSALIPHGHQGTVIITSRDMEIAQMVNSRSSNMDWLGAGSFASDADTKDQFCRTIPVREMQNEELKHLLLTRFNLPKAEISSELSERCDEALEFCNGLTMEVDMVAAYVAHVFEDKFGPIHSFQKPPAVTCRAICQALKESCRENFGFIGDNNQVDNPFPIQIQYDKPDDDVLGPTLDLLERQHKTASSLLRFLSLFRESHFPDELLKLVGETVSDREAREYPTWLRDCMNTNGDNMWVDQKYRVAIKWLRRYDLVSIGVARCIGPTVKVGPIRNHASLCRWDCEDNQLRMKFLIAARQAVQKRRSPVKQMLDYECVFAANDAMSNHFFFCKCPKEIELLFGQPLETFRASFQLEARLRALRYGPVASQKMIAASEKLMNLLVERYQTLSESREALRRRLAGGRTTSYKESISEWTQEKWEEEIRKVKKRGLSLEDEYNLLTTKYAQQQEEFDQRRKQIEESRIRERQEELEERMLAMDGMSSNFEKAMQRVYAEDEEEDAP